MAQTVEPYAFAVEIYSKSGESVIPMHISCYSG